MIVDTSALLAILKNEPEAQVFSDTLEEAKIVRISAANYLEAFIIVDRYRNPKLKARLEEILENPGMVIEPVTEEHAKIARQAYRDYGRGSGHPARLNFGDCFAYACAKLAGTPLLYKGDDFALTDIAPA